MLSPIRETIVFHDNFDQWSTVSTSDYPSVALKSSNWIRVYNGEASDICGFNRVDRFKQYTVELQEKMLHTPAALVFSGVLFRYAETIDFDILYGGKLSFYLTFAQVSSDESSCKTAFGG